MTPGGVIAYFPDGRRAVTTSPNPACLALNIQMLEDQGAVVRDLFNSPWPNTLSLKALPETVEAFDAGPSPSV